VKRFAAPLLISFFALAGSAPAQEIQYQPAIVTPDTHVELTNVARKRHRRRHHRRRNRARRTAGVVGNTGAGGALV